MTPAYEEKREPWYPDQDHWMEIDLAARVPDSFRVELEDGRVITKADLLRVEAGEPPLDRLDPPLADDDYCYLTTTGRVSGEPREIEIWFGLAGESLYMLSGGRDRSDWVKNLIKTPEVRVRIADRSFEGKARVVDDPDEEA